MNNWQRLISAKGKTFLLRVEASGDSADYEKYELLRNEIWGFPEDSLPGSRNLMCENFLHDGGALIISVYEVGPKAEVTADAAGLVAFSYGFVGVKDKHIAFQKTDNLRFYSQYTGIRGEYRGYGLGVAVKEFQRELVGGLFGISTITCTYDPLTGVNARRNVHHFQMDVEEYRVATYGEFGGLLNRLDVPSDRFFMSWDLRRSVGRGERPPATAISERQDIVRCQEEVVAGRTGPVLLETLSGVNLEADGRTLYVRIPRDFYLMLGETDVQAPEIRNIPVRWRLETRRVFQTFLARGYRVDDFFTTPAPSSKNYYTLLKTRTE